MVSVEPKTFHHNLLRDFAVDEGVLRIFTSAVVIRTNVTIKSIVGPMGEYARASVVYTMSGQEDIVRGLRGLAAEGRALLRSQAGCEESWARTR